MLTQLNQRSSTRLGFCKLCRKFLLLSRVGSVLQKRDSPQSFLPHVHTACITCGMQGWGNPGHVQELLRSNLSVEHPALTLCLLSHSQAEFQQCGCFLGQHNSQRGGWRGADRHQGVSEVPHHIPAHTAARSRPRLQACAGEQTQGVYPRVRLYRVGRVASGRLRGQQGLLLPEGHCGHRQPVSFVLLVIFSPSGPSLKSWGGVVMQK